MNFFQLNNLEGESLGILCTDLSEPEITEEWSEYIKENDSNDMGVDDFIEEVLNTKFSHMSAERFFIDSEINP